MILNFKKGTNNIIYKKMDKTKRKIMKFVLKNKDLDVMKLLLDNYNYDIIKLIEYCVEYGFITQLNYLLDIYENYYIFLIHLKHKNINLPLDWNMVINDTFYKNIFCN